MNEDEEVKQDEHERHLTELIQEYMMDPKVIELVGDNKELKDIYGKWLRTRYEEGRKEGRKEVVKNLKLKNISIDTICEVTGLTKEEVEKL